MHEHKFPNALNDDEHNHDEDHPSEFSLIELLVVSCQFVFDSLKKVITFGLSILMGIAFILDLFRDCMISIIYYLSLKKEDRYILKLILTNSDFQKFCLIKKRIVYIALYSHELKVSAVSRDESNTGSDYSSSFGDNTNFFHKKVSFIIQSYLKLRQSHILNHRYDFHIHSVASYKEIKTSIHKIDKIAQYL